MNTFKANKNKFDEWTEYMEDYNKTFPGRRATLLKVTRKYHLDEKQAVPTEKRLAATSSEAQRTQWLKSMTPETIFRMMVNEEEDDVKTIYFYNDRILCWLDSVEVFNKEHPKKQKPLLELLPYKDDELLTIVLTMKESPRPVTVKSRMLDAMSQAWLCDKATPEEIFYLFGLDKVKDNIFKDSRTVDWVYYVEKYNRNNSTPSINYIDIE